MPWWTQSGRAEELISSWQRPIYNLALRRLGHHADAADVTQEVFVAVLRDRPDLRSSDKLKPWIYRVAHNVISGHLRRRRLHRSKEEQAPERSSPPVTSEDAAQSAELQAVILEQIRRLPEPVQAPIVLRYYHDLTQAEIGDVLSLPRGTVRARLEKGLALLKRQLSLAGCAALAPRLETIMASAPSEPVPVELGEALRVLAPAAPAAALSAFLPSVIVTGALSALAFSGGLLLAGSGATEPRGPELAGPTLTRRGSAAEPPSALTEGERQTLEARIAGLERALAAASAPLPAAPPPASPAVKERGRRSARDSVRGLVEAMIAISNKSQAIVADAPSEEAKSIALAREITGQFRVLFYQLSEHKERALHAFLDVIADPERAEDHVSAGYVLSRLTLLPGMPAELGRLNERALALGDDPRLDPKLRACALSALHLRPDAPRHGQAYRSLSAVALDPEPILRSVAELKIATIPMAEAQADSLRRLYDAEAPVKHRLGLLYALRLHEDPRGLDALEPVLRDPEPLLRANAYIILNELPTSDALRRRLELAFESETEAALYLIGRPMIHHGDAATAAFLAGVAGDESRSLGRRGAASETRKALLKALEQDERP